MSYVARLRRRDSSFVISISYASCVFVIRSVCLHLISLMKDVDAAFLDVQMKFINAGITQDVVMAG